MKLGILARVRNNYQHGYINSKGKQIIECKFDEAGGGEKSWYEKRYWRKAHINTKGNFV